MEFNVDFDDIAKAVGTVVVVTYVVKFFVDLAGLLFG